MHGSYQTTVEKNHGTEAVFKFRMGGRTGEILCRDFPSPEIFIRAFFAHFKDSTVAKEF